jgi:serine/threonine protein kinase/Tfp pilus assembly protein PilF
LPNEGEIEMIGTTLSHFRITDKLGEGGMGEVWLAEDVRLGRKVALKILPAERAESEDRRRRFEDEARAASALNHPGIAHIYDIGEADGTHFIAMEHVDGESLDQRTARMRLTIEEIVDLGARLAEALAAAHGQGVTHRDIKPSNLMIDAEGRLKVLDFGLAKLRPALGGGGEDATTQTMTQPGVVMGTVQYMSPEQALGRDADHRSDIFSTGIVLYQMVTGKLPFSGSTPTETITEIVRSEPVPVSELSPVSPPELQRIISKCMEKELSRRYQNARDLAVDLANLRRDTESGVSVVAPSRPARSRTALTIAAVAAALIVGAGFLLTRSDLWSGGAEPIESIAVLPFENGTGNAESEYLCDGLTESLINTLSQIPDLKVISRRSAFAFKGSEDDPQTIGRRLAVQALLMGRMVQRGDQLAVSAELVDVSDDHQLWGGRFNRDQRDVLAIEEDLAKTIAATLKVELSGDTEQKLARRFEVDPEAHRLFLKSRQFIVGSQREMTKAVDYLQRAIEKDPTYALAYAWLGYVYMIQAYHNVMNNDEALRLGKEALDTAFELDPGLAEAHAVAGNIACFFDWDWDTAERRFRRAIELDPRSVMARMAYSDFLVAMGRLDEAIEHSLVAKSLDPLSPSPAHWLAIAYMGQHRYDLAVTEFQETLEINPNWTWGYIKLAKAFADAGRCEEALETADDAEAQLHGGSTPLARSWLGYTYAVCGDEDGVELAFQELEAFASKNLSDPGNYAAVSAGLRDTEAVLDALSRGIEVRSPDAAYLPVYPALFLDGLQNEPRYLELYNSMKYGPHATPGGPHQ